MKRRSVVRSSKSKSPGVEKKLYSTPSSPEAKRKDQYSDDGESDDDIEENGSIESIGQSEEEQDSCNNRETTRKRIPSNIREEPKNETCVGKLFPNRRSSYHISRGEDHAFQRSIKGPVSVNEDISSFSVEQKNQVTFGESNLKFGSFSTSEGQWYRNIIYIVPLLFVLICAILYINLLKLEPTTLTIDSMKQRFPKQKDLLWKAVTSGLNETLQFEYPSSYILIHEREADDTVKKLIRDISRYAVCHLSNCDNIPIELNSKVLNSSELADNSDYGVIISRYKEALENIGVMVIENLDEIPEKYALAFHSFCDQVSPLVKKSAFFFSIKIDKLGKSPKYDIREVEKILRDKWKHIEDDIFEPLFTRLAAMLIRIHPE